MLTTKKAGDELRALYEQYTAMKDTVREKTGPGIMNSRMQRNAAGKSPA